MHTRRTVIKVMMRRNEDDTGPPPQYSDQGVAPTHLPIMEIRTC